MGVVKQHSFLVLCEGWKVEEIKRWSKERWKSGNPREWPPRKKE
jgi:hypothetical protein